MRAGPILHYPLVAPRDPDADGVPLFSCGRDEIGDDLVTACGIPLDEPQPAGGVRLADRPRSPARREQVGSPTAVTAGSGGGMLTGMKQVVRFAATPAGRVAYSVTGSGPPLVCLLGWVSHLGLMWENPEHRRFVEALAREHTVIRYDKVGCGLSDRARTDFTMESELAVLEALVEHLELERFALFGSCEGGQVAAAYAARHPDVVSSLIVYGSCARGADLAPTRSSSPCWRWSGRTGGWARGCSPTSGCRTPRPS